jgi:hypothetical protein
MPNQGALYRRENRPATSSRQIRCLTDQYDATTARGLTNSIHESDADEVLGNTAPEARGQANVQRLAGTATDAREDVDSRCFGHVHKVRTGVERLRKVVD